MFTIVHRSWAIIAVCYALFFLSALPGVALSQEENVDSTTPEEQVEVASTEESEYQGLLGMYPSEGVPGGGAAIGDFVVGPGKIDVTINPGETKIVEMNVTNRTGETRRFKITVEDVVGSQSADKPLLLLGDDKGPYSIRDYIYVPHNEFDLEHNQRARIPVTITLPQNAEPAGLYGSVLVETLAVKGKAGNTGGTVPQSPIIARIGTIFFVTIPGDVEKDLVLSKFGTMPEKMFYQNSPINFGILHENNGSIHAAPYGEMRIHNIFGEEVGYLELEPWFVLPQSVRLREISWNREVLFGRYTATAYINRSYDDIIDEVSYSFWVLPWKPVAGGFLVLFIVIFTIRSFFKRFEFTRKT